MREVSLPPGSFKSLRTIANPLIVVLVGSAERPAIMVRQRILLPKPPVVVPNHQIVCVLRKEIIVDGVYLFCGDSSIALCALPDCPA